MRTRLVAVTLVGAATLLSTGAALASADMVWAGCGITKTAFMAELAKAYEKKTGTRIDIQGGGATRGIRDVSSGATHLGGACRTTLPGESAERNVKQVPVGWDALVVITHPSNPIENLSFSQLRDIYLGKITNWKALGGPDMPMDVYARQGKISGVGRMMREIVFADYEQELAATHVVKSTGPLEEAVTQNPRAIGVTGVSSAKRRGGLKILNLNSREPSYENIKSGDYLLYRPLYLVVPANNKDPRIDAFTKFALSPEGQQVIKTAGTVPYVEGMPLVMKQIEQYREATRAGL